MPATGAGGAPGVPGGGLRCDAPQPVPPEAAPAAEPRPRLQPLPPHLPELQRYLEDPVTVTFDVRGTQFFIIPLI